MTLSDASTLVPSKGPLQRYEAMIAEGALQSDPAQRDVIEDLQRLHERLRSEGVARSKNSDESLLGRLGLNFRRRTAEDRQAASSSLGVYIHGPVGRGKSMVMDLFFEEAQVVKKRRVHFHAFMQDVHGRLKILRDGGSDPSSSGRKGMATDDAIPTLADRLFEEVTLLCFDEFHVQNIADAMILGRLFDCLFDKGLVMVATSNFPPERLYENGLNRDRFLPFIARLKERLDVLSLAGPTDYRLDRLQNQPVYYCPHDPSAEEALARIFDLLTDGASGGTDAIEIGSRRLLVPKAARGVAWFNFAGLCEQPLGAADYLALAGRYHTLILEQVPALTRERHNEARRFMTLVDALYECRVNLVISAETEPADLYQAGEGAFEFARTTSRLMEMQSRRYIETPPSTIAAADFVPFALTTDLT